MATRGIGPALIWLGVAALAGCRPGSAGTSPTVTPAPSTPSPSTPSSPPVSAPATGVPSRAEIARVMARTAEAGTPEEHFVPGDRPRTAPDGQGGTLTAVIGQRHPTSDGHGQIVFFWHGTRFLGWDSVFESDSITRVAPAGNGFRATYTRYAANDPECCASLPPVTLAYRWTGQRLASSGTPPVHGRPIRVRLLS
jgi:hypothetical protein